VRKEIVGFDAIREEEEAKDISPSVAVKAVVAAKKSPAKEKAALAQPLPEVKESVESVASISSVEEKQVQTEHSFSGAVADGGVAASAQAVEEPASAAVSSLQDFVPLSEAQLQQQQSGSKAPENATENPFIPAEAFVPMVPVVEEQVTQWYPLNVVCSMLRDQGRMVDLENLLCGSTGIRREDRKMVFMWTLQSYVDHGMLDRAVLLSKRLEWEGLAYDFPEFHALMGSLIQNYTYRVELPSPAMSMSVSPATTPYASCPSTPIFSGTEEQLAIQAHYHRKLKKAIAKENGAEGLAALTELEKTGKQVNVTEMSSLVELLVKEERLQVTI
jgi:hypothetical protein